MGFGVFLVHPPIASVLLSASVERCFVSRMRDFFYFFISPNLLGMCLVGSKLSCFSLKITSFVQFTYLTVIDNQAKHVGQLSWTCFFFKLFCKYFALLHYIVLELFRSSCIVSQIPTELFISVSSNNLLKKVKAPNYYKNYLRPKGCLQLEV